MEPLYDRICKQLEVVERQTQLNQKIDYAAELVEVRPLYREGTQELASCFEVM